MANCSCRGWLWWWRIWWNEDWQGKPKYSEKTCPSATLSTTNPTWPDPGRRGGKPATNCLSYGAVFLGLNAVEHDANLIQLLLEVKYVALYPDFSMSPWRGVQLFTVLWSWYRDGLRIGRQGFESQRPDRPWGPPSLTTGYQGRGKLTKGSETYGFAGSGQKSGHIFFSFKLADTLFVQAFWPFKGQYLCICPV
jgi:hypothetical protein